MAGAPARTGSSTIQLGQVLRYGRSAYESLLELFADEPEEFMEMFPGPCISARDVLLEDRA